MCRSCGAIVGAGENQCAVCGAPTSSQPTSATPQRPVDRETLRFARAVFNRPYKVTVILLVANIFVFLLMWESSELTSRSLWQGFEEPVLQAYGAKLNYLINAPHYQWWRLIAPMFIHVNVIHLIVNMYSLMIVGPFVEKLYGSAKFTFFWVLTGIAGLVASYLAVRPHLATGPLARFIFKSQDVPSAGASGALFGLVGVLFVFGIKFRKELPEGFKRAFGTGLLPIILINLFIGFIGRGFIDNAAHLGGLLAGAILAIGVDYQRPGVRRTITIAWRGLQILALSVVVVVAYKVARNFSAPVATNRPASQNANTLIFVNYLQTMNQLQEKVSAVIYNGDLSDVGVISDRAGQAPAPDAQADELRNSLLVILSNFVDAGAEAGPTSTQTREKLLEEYKQWQKQYHEWLQQNRAR